MGKWDKKKRLWILGTGEREERIEMHIKNLKHYFEIYPKRSDSDPDKNKIFKTGYAMALKIIVYLFNDTLSKPEEIEEAIKRFAKESLKSLDLW